MENITITTNATIDNVSDTALWVAHYRALETERPQPLFRDPLAKVLAGEKGKQIAEHMGKTSRYTNWTVVIRTHIIDNFIMDLIREGVDTVINLGAGLDTRPYRMLLPANLKWIEVDYPQIINHKNSLLANEKPKCHLERVTMDLADRTKRQTFFTELNTTVKKALIITEGVIPYLTPEQVSSLAEDLHNQSNFSYWITEYFSPKVYPYIHKQKEMRQKMKNAPFLFFPPEWFPFFEKQGWVPREIQYTGEVSKKLNRPMPMPWFAFFFIPFMSQKAKQQTMRMTGFVLWKKKGGNT